METVLQKDAPMKNKRIPRPETPKVAPPPVPVSLNPKVTKIRVDYSDGSAREAVGDDADKIMEHWNGLEQFAWIHNMTYSGPCLEEVQKPKGKSN